MRTARQELERVAANPSVSDPPTTGLGEALLMLAGRIDQIEARQRVAEMHDPNCRAAVRERSQRRTDVYLPPEAYPCTCWLKE